MKQELKDGFLLSEIESTDKTSFIEHFREKQIYDQTLNIPYPYTQQHADEWFEYVANETKQIGHPINWAIRSKDGKLIGGIGFHGFESGANHRGELGYWLAKSYWNKGLITEAIKAVTAFGFEKMGLARITAHVFHFNQASARALEKAGFQYEGRLRNHYCKDNKIFDGKLYAMTDIPAVQPPKSRPEFIKHYYEIQEPDSAHYPNSDELLSIGSPFAKKFGLTRLGIHHELLPPGRRTSWPHAESEEEEFVYVIEGNPDVWIDGDLHRLNPGDAVGFVAGTGICHTFLNNTKADIRLLVVGEATKKTNKCFYALHPKRNEQAKIEGWLWEDPPQETLGNHDGVPNEAFVQPTLETSRLTLEPIHEGHATELCELFADSELHTYVPFEPPTLKQQSERCARWAKRKSPDGKELWLNWLARDTATKKPVGHFQAGVGQDAVASIGYVVGRQFQNQGLATEALGAVFEYLKERLGVRQVKAWSDTRNLASHRLAQKMGMVQIEVIKNADSFKGSTSDEFIFSKDLI